MDDEPDDRTVQERAARQIDARAARFGAVLVSLLAAGFLLYGGILLVRAEVFKSAGALLVAVLGALAAFILSDVNRDDRTQRAARRIALSIVPFALLANLIQLFL